MRQKSVTFFSPLSLVGAIVVLVFGWVDAATAVPTAAIPIATPSAWLYLPLISRDFDASWQWQAPSPVLSPVPPTATNTLPVTAIDRQGQLHLLWGINTSRPEGKYIYHSALTVTGWITPTAILQTLGTSYSPFTPVVGLDGTLHLFWLNKLTSDSMPRLLYSSYRNGKWAPEEEVYDYPPYGVYDVHTSATGQVDRSGQVYAIVQYVHLSLHTQQAIRTAPGWQLKTVPDTGRLDLNDWMLGDSDGAVRRFISRYQNSAYHGYYSYWVDGSYLIKDAPLSFVPHNTYGQLDAANNLHIYWRAEVPVPGGQVMGLFHQCFDPNMAPAGEPELLTGQEATAATLLPAADEAGRWTLAWQMAATGEARIGVWQGCARHKIVSVPAVQMTPWPPYQALFSHVPNRWCGVWKAGTTGYRVRCADIT